MTDPPLNVSWRRGEWPRLAWRKYGSRLSVPTSAAERRQQRHDLQRKIEHCGHDGVAYYTPMRFQLVLDEGDRVFERSPPRADVLHRDVLVPDRHATEQHELVWG